MSYTECIRLKRGGDRRHVNINYTENESSMDKLENILWCVARPGDVSETDGKG